MSPLHTGLLRWFAHEPMVHFLALGSLIFVVFNAIHLDDDKQKNRIEITTTDLERLRAMSQQQWGRQPDAQQMRALVQAHVREEVLVREAMASGLDREDVIVRRRLAQKMEFLAHADVSAPSETELRQYYVAHAAQYQQGIRVDFEHLYFRNDRLGSPTQLAAHQAGQALAHGAPVQADHFMLGNPFLAQDRSSLERDFGTVFADAVAQMPEKVWSAPVASVHGLHLVRVLRRAAAVTPPLDAVRDRVTADIVNARVSAARDASFARQLTRYTVVLPEGQVKLSAAPSTVAQP